jgi:hypothetical protein
MAIPKEENQARTRMGLWSNPGLGTFVVGDTTVKIRYAKVEDIRPIMDLLNREALATQIAELFGKRPEAMEYFKKPPNERGEQVPSDFDRVIEKATRDGKTNWTLVKTLATKALTTHVKAAGLEDPFVDQVDSIEVHNWIMDRLSIVTEVDGKIVAHMCGRNVRNHVNWEGEIVEITAGLVDPEYRDFGRQVALQIQDRNRFALLSEIAVRFPYSTVVSISKQPAVSVGLEASGFYEADDQEKSRLRPVIWEKPWKARLSAPGRWESIVEKVGDVEGYCAAIARREAEIKAEKDKAKAIVQKLERKDDATGAKQ